MYCERMLELSAALVMLFVLQCPSTSVNYYHIGCFKDKSARAMPKGLGVWRNDNNLIQKCAEAAKKAGYLAFAVQYKSECWSGPQAHMTYSMYGTSSECINGIGGAWAQDVYFFNSTQVGNYDVRRCYKLNVIFHYNIPGGLNSNTIAQKRTEFTTLVKGTFTMLGILPECSSVVITGEDIVTSPPGVNSVFFRVPVVFTASNSIPYSQVSSELTTCISKLMEYKGILDNRIPSITQGGRRYQKYNDSTITDKKSCCGGDIPPPCCAVGSVKVSSTKCACLPGFYHVPSRLCVRCPVDTYQENQEQRKCKKCPEKKQTFGKTGMTSKTNCSDTNPLQLRAYTFPSLPYNVKEGTVIANVTVTGKPASLVLPFLYYLDSVTPRQQQARPTRRQSRTLLKRRRRGDVNGFDDICEEAGTIEPLNYFCIHRLSGKIGVTKDFVFTNGEEFELKVRVTDSDPWGKTENAAVFRLISYDRCHKIRKFYDESVKFCSNVSSALLCPNVNCLVPLFNWQMALNTSSERTRSECSFDPQNMEITKQRYSSCIGPPEVKLNPVSRTLPKGEVALLSCNASSALPMKITWFKNEKQIGFGSQLQIDSFENDDQGNYFCKFTTVLTSIYSKAALLVLKDVITSIVSFRIINQKHTDDLSDPSSPRYSDMQVNIQRNLENYFNSGNPPWGYQVELIKFRNSFSKVGAHIIIYSLATIADFTSYYSRLERLFADESEINKLLKTLKVSRKSVTIRSATHCLPEKTGKNFIMGIFDWQLTVIGQKDSPVKCPYGPTAATATRLCGGSFSTGGIWKNPDVSLCKFKSERTNKLNALAKGRIDRNNVDRVTKEVKDLTSKADDMNEADAVLIADVIGNVVSLGDSLNETAQDVVDVIDNVMNMKRKDLQESQRANKASSKFVEALDTVAHNLPLSANQSSRRLVAPSLAIQSSRADPDSFSGMSLAVKPPAADPNKLSSASMVNKELPMADVQTSIKLPKVMFKSQDSSVKVVKIGFVIYQNDKFFQPVIPDDVESDANTFSVMSRIISSSVQGMTFDNMTKPVELVFEPVSNFGEDSGETVCSFWDFSAIGGLGNWSDRGCKLMKTDAGRVKCHCDHMTNFAVLFSASGPKSRAEHASHAVALSIISYVGCAISLVGLTLTLLTYSLFRNLRKTNQQPILMNLCVSLMLLLIVFIVGADQTGNLIGCRLVACLLHFFVLASVMWMGVEGYNIYMCFVQVMATYQSKFMLKASAVAWGIPAVIVIITVSVATSYYGNNDVCVLHGLPFQVAQFTPILAIIIINFVIFILAIRALHNSGALVSAEKKSSSYQRARTAIAILLLLGLTWLFGALAISRAQIAFEYLFCIFNSLQGFLIFYFHCLRQQEVRSQWIWFLRGKGLGFQKAETDSRTGYPRTVSRGNNYKMVNRSSSMAMPEEPPKRKETVLSSVSDHSPKSQLRHQPDVIPAYV